MTTFVQLSDENEPIVDLAVLLDSILKVKQKKGKTGAKDTESKSEAEEADEESDKEEKDEEGEGEKEEGEKGDKGEDGSEEETEKPAKKGKPKKKEKPKEDSKEEEESAWITLAKEGRPLNFLEQVFVPNLAQLFESNPTEAEAAWEIATSILEHIVEHEVNEEDEEAVVDEATLTAARKLVIRLGTLLSTPSDADKKSSQIISLKLRCLLTLYNTFKSNPIPQQLFIQVLRYAIWSENGNLLVNSLSDIEQTIRTVWKPKLTELRDIYLLLSQIFAQANRSSETQKYRLAFLKTFETGKDSKEFDQAADAAVAAIVTAISTANSVHYQILSNLKVISSLSTHKDHAKAVRLLTIFAKENLESYNKFYSENAAYIKKIGLDHEANVRQMRSLTICSLGLNQESVSYETLMKTLQVSDEIGLEEAVIDAVQQEKVEAKIDQESQQVLIERVSARVFEDTQWKQIGEKLEAWKQELGRALQSLQHAQQPSSTVSQPQSRSRAS